MSEEVKTDNLIMRVFLETIDNIVGSNGLKSILNYAHLEKYIGNFPPDNDEQEIPVTDLEQLYTALYEMFGNKGAFSLQLRVGRENVHRGLEKRPKIAKTMRIACKIVPENTKIRLGLENLKEYMEKGSSNHSEVPLVEILEQDDCFLLVQRENIMGSKITSDKPVCGITLGIIEALVEWITGHSHEVKEIECTAMGHPADIFRVSKASS